MSIDELISELDKRKFPMENILLESTQSNFELYSDPNESNKKKFLKAKQLIKQRLAFRRKKIVSSICVNVYYRGEVKMMMSQMAIMKSKMTIMKNRKAVLLKIKLHRIHRCHLNSKTMEILINFLYSQSHRMEMLTSLMNSNTMK